MPAEKPAEDWELRYHAAVGRIIREWAGLEHSLGNIFHVLLGSDQIRARMIWSMQTNVKARLDMLRWFSDQFLEDPDHAELQKLVKRAGRIVSTRNVLAHHSGNYFGENEILFFTDKQADGEFFQSKKMTMNELKVCAAAIGALNDELMRFYISMVKGQIVVLRQPKPWRKIDEAGEGNLD